MVAEQRESQRMVQAESRQTVLVPEEFPRTAGVQPESQRLAQVPAESPLTAPEVQLLALPASAPAGPLRPLVPPPQAAALGCRFSFAGRR